MADDIAYDNHDIDDGLRAGFLELDDLLTLDFIADQWREVERRFPNAPRDRQLRELVREQLGWTVNDVIEHTRGSTQGLTDRADIATAGRPLGGFSPAMLAAERRLKAFMYAKLYYHPEQTATAEKANAAIAQLWNAYCEDPRLMSANWYAKLPDEEPYRSRHIADYIAGMTDRFALDRVREIYGEAPDDLSNV